MALKAKSKNTKTVKTYPAYYGVDSVEVVAVNPTKAELELLGVNFNNEPEYVDVEINNDIRSKVAFYVKSYDTFTTEEGTEKPKVNDKIEILISNDLAETRSGKSVFMNHRGQAAIVESFSELTTLDKWKWFLPENRNLTDDCIRQAMVGESNIWQVLIAWLNLDITEIDEEDESTWLMFGKGEIPAFEDLVRGDVSFLRDVDADGESLISEDHGLKVLAYVDGKGYTRIWQNAFDKDCDPKLYNITSSLDYAIKQNKPPKGYFGNKLVKGFVKYNDEASAFNPVLPQDLVTDADVPKDDDSLF